MQETFHVLSWIAIFSQWNVRFGMFFCILEGYNCLLVHNEVGGPGSCFPNKRLNFLNVRDADFIWQSGRLFPLLQMPSLQNLKIFFRDPPPPHFRPNIFLLTPPLKPYFFRTPPSTSTVGGHLYKVLSITVKAHCLSIKLNTIKRVVVGSS